MDFFLEIHSHSKYSLYYSLYIHYFEYYSMYYLLLPFTGITLILYYSMYYSWYFFLESSRVCVSGDGGEKAIVDEPRRTIFMSDPGRRNSVATGNGRRWGKRQENAKSYSIWRGKYGWNMLMNHEKKTSSLGLICLKTPNIITISKFLGVLP